MLVRYPFFFLSVVESWDDSLIASLSTTKGTNARTEITNAGKTAEKL